MTDTTNQTAKYSKNYSGDVGETPKSMAGTWHLEAPDGRKWAGSGPLACVAQEISERVPVQVQLARVLAIADEPDLDERHTLLGVEYGTVKVDELVDKLYAEIEALRAKLNALEKQRPCGYLPYGYVGRLAMVHGQPVPESVPIYLAAGAREEGANLTKAVAALKNISNDNWPDADLNAGEYANLVLHELAAGARPVEAGPAAVVGPLAERTIFDAIRSAYDLGYNDARNARTVPGDSAPGYKGRQVEADHGGALASRLTQLAATPTTQLAPEAQSDAKDAARVYDRNKEVFRSAN